MGKEILVCGGAGYIGSHMVKMLSEQGHTVTTFDNLSTGHRDAVQWGSFVEGDLLNSDDLKQLFDSNNFDVVMHFSARSLVGESVQKPALYYQNNVIGTYNLLEAMRQADINKFIFSSTAAVYGYPEKDLIDESHPKKPINPYGHSKLMVEQMLEDYASAYGLNSVRLRYFNAAGADASGLIGEAHDPETHLIPNILKSILSNSSSSLKIFGDDYDTHDGTCVRDYIHINDICNAHIKAMEYLDTHNGSYAFNLGNSSGFSVLDVITATETIVKQKIPYTVEERRAGDPSILVANSTLAQKELQWQPECTSIDDIIESAWNWHKDHKTGFNK